MRLIYQDNRVVVAIKPKGVLSTDAPGGMPDLVRQALGDGNACVRTVHRLDQVVGGLMVLARSAMAASLLSAQIRSHTFEKSYLAVIHGVPDASNGTLRDILLRDKEARKTYVVEALEKGAQEAVLEYRLLETAGELSLIHIRLITGRTHQIRAQFSARKHPLVGDRKYGNPEEDCGIALWSYTVAFDHPQTGQRMTFSAPPPEAYPWSCFSLLPNQTDAEGEE